MRKPFIHKIPDELHASKNKMQLNYSSGSKKATTSNEICPKPRKEEFRLSEHLASSSKPQKYRGGREPKLSEVNSGPVLVTSNKGYALEKQQLNNVSFSSDRPDKTWFVGAAPEATTGSELSYSLRFLPDRRLCLPTLKGFKIVKLQEIVYCEAQRSYTRFHFTNNKILTVSRPLFDYDNLLSDTFFLRIHKSFLINLLKVKEYLCGEGGTVVMSNGMEIEVSRRKKELFMAKVKEFFKY